MASKPSVSKKKSVLSGKTPRGESYTLWGAVDWSIVSHLVVTVCRAGGTVQLGVTQNGTAATIRIYHGGQGETFYAGDLEAIYDLCGYWANEFDDYED